VLPLRRGLPMMARMHVGLFPWGIGFS